MVTSLYDLMEDRQKQMLRDVISELGAPISSDLAGTKESSIYNYSAPGKANIPSVHLLCLQHRAAKQGSLLPAEISVPVGYKLVLSDLPKPTGDVRELCWSMSKELVQFEAGADVGHSIACYEAVAQMERICSHFRAEIELINNRMERD